MNIPFTLDKIKQHPRDLLLLTYYQFNMCTSSIVNYGTGETPTCFVYPSKEYDEVAVRRALRDWSGLSADTIYRHYDNIAVREVVQSQTFALLSKEQFEKIYDYLEKDFPDYQKRNQMFRVLIYMYVQCCNFTPYTESLSNMAAELEINRNWMSCGIRYAIYRHWIGYTRKAFYDGKTRQASSYQFYREMVPEDLQDNLWYRKHILTRKPTPEEEQHNLDLLARYASHSVYENYPKDYIIELFNREG